jgi:hypothetical protein
MLLISHKGIVAMLSYLVRQILLDALSGGPPYAVATRSISALIQIELLAELESRGLITSGPFPVLTDNGITEAQWFANSVKRTDVKSSEAEEPPLDRRAKESSEM